MTEQMDQLESLAISEQAEDSAAVARMYEALDEMDWDVEDDLLRLCFEAYLEERGWQA